MVNITSGMNFLVNSLNINLESIPAAFSFRFNPTVNTTIINRDPWASGSSSGILNTIGGNGFFTYSGTGTFNGLNPFKLSKNYQLNNSTILLSYEKLRFGDEILLSSITGNSFSTYSGFYVGINDANKLYLKYWNNVEGLFSFTYNGVLSDKNIILVNRNTSSIILGHFNNNTFQFETQEFKIFENNFINNNELFIGGTQFRNNLFSNAKNFSGYLDRFYIFDNIPLFYANVLVRGFFSEPTGFEGELEEYCFTTGFLSGSGFSFISSSGVQLSGFQSGIVSITGYRNFLSGFSYSGVTGFNNVNLGSYIDNCGNFIQITDNIPLSGLISGEVLITEALTGINFVSGFIEIPVSGVSSGIENVFVTGKFCNTYFSNIGDVLYKYDENYLKSLSYKEINLLSRTKSEDDIIEIFTEEYKPKKLNYNVNLTFDTLNENYFYIDQEFKQNEILLFGNGQALIDSGFQLIPSGYETIRSPNLDYFITGTTIETNKFFGDQDYLFYDYISGSFWASKQSGSNITIPINLNDNYWIFRNGQKLRKGVNDDYIISPFIEKYILTGNNALLSSQVNIRTQISNDGSIIFISSSTDLFNFPNSNSIAAAIYIYTGNLTNGWQLRQKILNPNYPNQNIPLFGNSISINDNGSILAIGASDFAFTYTGNPINGWHLQQTFTPAQNENLFGHQVEITKNGETLFINSFINNTGALMYIYTGSNINNWNLKQKITGGASFLSYSASNNDGSVFITHSGINNVLVYTGNNISAWKIRQVITGVLRDGGVSSLLVNDDGSLLIINTGINILDQNINIYLGNPNNGWVYNQTLRDSTIPISNVFGVQTQRNNNGNVIIVTNNFGCSIFTKNTNNQFFLKQTVNEGFRVFDCSCSNDGSFIVLGRGIPTGESLLQFSPKIYQTFIDKININNINQNQENYYIIKEISDNFIYHSGNSGFLTLTGAFNHGCSQVYYNGIKQKINNNYIENSRFDFISGEFSQPNEFQKLIYNNTDDFFV